ncbi:MAG: glycoside hydrolase family 2 TIM barrel-domain containing protein [Bacteroidales bacterium]|nr:glycoside hydrolase family 2 TIM barrel-domain containing protein [Bacteroidales bacterium]
MRKKLYTFALATSFSAISWAQVSFGNATHFNDDWKFVLADDSTSRQANYDDTKWRQLNLPHDWSIEGQLSPNMASCTGYYPGGIGWYRKHFDYKKTDKKQYIYFEGVYNRSEVYLNGRLLGKRPSGFASFLYDMTPYLQEGENVLSVRVDHSRYADSRWYTGSGIYRDVWRVEAPQNHLAQWGTGYKCTKLTNASATIDVEVAVDFTQQNTRAKIGVELFDAKGKRVAQENIGKVAKSEGKNRVSLKVNKPKRWDLDSPYLYTMVTTLYEDGKAVDSNQIKVGLRSIEFDADKGFSLNGRNMKVKGVCLHHDAGVLGAVVPEDVWRRRLINLKAIGANAIRCAHNPQAPVLYDLCDELGLLVMDEASDEWEFPKRKWVEGWNVGTPSFDGTYDFFEEWIDRDVTDMVRRDRNHPSIILWSIGNEVDYPNDPYSHPVLDGKNSAINQPMFGGYDPSRPNAERIGKIAKRLSACVRSVDTSRPVTGALAGVVMSNETEYPEAVDVVGYNYTENRYAEDHATYPKRVIYGSENGVGYDAWMAVANNDYIFGQFIWTGTDYLGESGRWPSRGLHTGLLDFGSNPKPRGHFRASLWCEKPVCYIGTYPIREQKGRRQWLSQDAPDLWNYDEGQRVRVVCYTNAPKARLLLDGNEIGAERQRDIKNGMIYWDVDYNAGELRAESLDEQGNVVAEYAIKSSGRPYELRATADVETLATGGRVAHISLDVLDENGVLVRLADNNIRCTVVGPARLLGLENSDNTDMTNHRDNQERVFRGKLLAYVASENEEGEVEVKFSSPLIKGTSVKLKVKK